MNHDQKIVKKIKKTVAGNIKKYRTDLDLTQDQAAEKADITVKYWQRLEMTSQPDLPSLPMLYKVAKALNIEVCELIK